jgi:histidinol dehydrogenase
VAEEDVRQLQEAVKSILARVLSEGGEAVRYYEKEFDNYEPPILAKPKN